MLSTASIISGVSAGALASVVTAAAPSLGGQGPFQSTNKKIV